jgi:hypothetical protein
MTSRPKCKLFATLSVQGTAMSETLLTEAEYRDPVVRQRTEAEALGIDDAAKPIQWADVTENEAFWPETGDVRNH